MPVRIATIQDVREAERVIRRHVSPDPLIRSYALERELGFPETRRVRLKDYGWTPVGSFKLLGALNWMARNLERIEDRPVAAHSSGNFACGISFAGMKFGKRILIVHRTDDWLPNGQTLVADNTGLHECDRKGKQVWHDRTTRGKVHRF
ncbi:MAG: pyridoxal-phosphate dependent enzyme [Planctomycetes bacterium]|nr:pyridoxal-phosphate dependent enzyme [Planctomycetota bacterium]